MNTLTETRPTANGYASTPCVDVGTREAVGPCGRVYLSPAQYDLLLALATLPPRHVLTRPDIVAVLYGERNRAEWLSYTQLVDAMITRLNARLQEAGLGRPVRAARGHGYRLEVGVEYLLRRETAR